MNFGNVLHGLSLVYLDSDLDPAVGSDDRQHVLADNSPRQLVVEEK